MRRLAALTAAAVALTLTACGNPTPDSEVEIEDELGVPADPESGDEETQADAIPGGGPIPQPGECIDLPPTDDHTWTVADAGLVTAGDAEGVLSADVQPAGGWSYDVEGQGEDEVLVTLHSEQQTYELHLESGDGDIEAELCATE